MMGEIQCTYKKRTRQDNIPNETKTKNKNTKGGMYLYLGRPISPWTNQKPTNQ